MKASPAPLESTAATCGAGTWSADAGIGDQRPAFAQRDDHRARPALQQFPRGGRGLLHRRRRLSAGQQFDLALVRHAQVGEAASSSSGSGTAGAGLRMVVTPAALAMRSASATVSMGTSS